MSENSNLIYNVPGHTQAEDTLLSYPPAIQAQQKVLLEVIEHREAVNSQVKEIIAGFNAQISNNPALTNADKRATELKRMMAASAEYQEAYKEWTDLNHQVEIEQIDLEYLNNMFRAHVAIVGGHR